MAGPLRLARALTLAILIGYAAAATAAVTVHWQLADVEVYWRSGLAIRDGTPLYPGSADPDFMYRYAPWFAWLWAPLTYLPRGLVAAAWSLVLVGAAVASLWPALRNGTITGLAVALLFWPMLYRDASSGNVQTLLLASLVWSVERRTGPIFIALAASLKAFPLLFAVVYVGRRQWGRAALAVGLSLLLAAPILLYGEYPLVAGEGQVQAAYLILAATTIGASMWLAHTRFGVLAAGLAVMFSLPRWLPGQPAWILPATNVSPRAKGNAPYP